MTTTTQIQIEEQTPETAPGDSGNYRTMVGALASAAFRILAVKVAAIVLASNFVGARIEIDFLQNVVPAFRIVAPTQDFATIVTFSTALMAGTAALLMAAPAIEGGWDRQVVWGRGLALVLAIETFIFEFGRHVMEPPVLIGRWMWVPAFELLCGALLFAVARSSPQRSLKERAKSPDNQLASVGEA